MKKITYILLLFISFSYGQQLAAPTSDITTIGVSSGTFASIDEATANDGDYVVTADNTAATYEAKFASLTDPNVHTGHIVRFRIAKADTGVPPSTDGNGVTCVAGLYQGATLITDMYNAPIGAWDTREFTLSEAQAANITDYSDLRVRFDFSASGGNPSNRRGGAVSWLEIQVPDPVTSSRRIFIIN